MSLLDTKIGLKIFSLWYLFSFFINIYITIFYKEELKNVFQGCSLHKCHQLLQCCILYSKCCFSIVSSCLSSPLFFKFKDNFFSTESAFVLRSWGEQQFKDLSPHNNREHLPWLEVKLPTIKTLWVPGLPGCVFQLCVRNSHPSRWCGAAGSKHTAQRQSDSALKCNKRAKRVKLEFKVLYLRNCSQVQEALLSCWRSEERLTSHLCF